MHVDNSSSASNSVGASVGSNGKELVFQLSSWTKLDPFEKFSGQAQKSLWFMANFVPPLM